MHVRGRTPDFAERRRVEVVAMVVIGARADVVQLLVGEVFARMTLRAGVFFVLKDLLAAFGLFA